jgi:hypothetical protein
MSSEPDSTFVVTTDDVQVAVDITPMVKRGYGSGTLYPGTPEYLARGHERREQVWEPIFSAIPDEHEYLFADDREPPQAYDPYPEVSAKCSLEDTADFLSRDGMRPECAQDKWPEFVGHSDDYDSYPYIEEGWDD